VYNDDGTVRGTTDPDGVETRMEYDDAGRLVRRIDNYDDGTPGPDDKDRATEYGYVAGLRTKMTAVMPGTQDDQETVYIYGTSKGAAANLSKIATGHLLRAVKYPDSTNTETTAPGGSTRTTTTW
jgi:YD repeat-containing protein